MQHLERHQSVVMPVIVALVHWIVKRQWHLAHIIKSQTSTFVSLILGFNLLLISILPHSSTHSRMRSKRLRTTEEPIALDGSTALTSSKRKGLGGPTGPKVRKSAAGTSCKEEEEKEKKMEAESKHKQNQNPFQLSGKRPQVYCMRGCDLNRLTACLCCCLPCGTSD